MTEKEIVQALNLCQNEDSDCRTCKLWSIDRCVEHLTSAAAGLIERLTAENAKAEAERDALREKVPQWISVGDRLPKPGERVIATDGVSAGEAYMGVSGELQRLNLPLRWLTLTGNDATHWMPLPDVPKEEKT